ncbi:MAG TPA: SPOR domain-containing protein [Terracidiphilus sp.]|jgi:cell division septation protein DedD
MPRGFGNTAFEPVQETRDTELTLGPAALIGLAAALFVVCGTFFFWGYSIGHRNPAEGLAVAPAPSTEPSAAQLLSQSKPAPNQSALPNHADTQDPAAAADEPAPSASKAAVPVAAAYTPGNAAPPAGGSPAMVQTALPAQQAASQPAAAGQVQSALSQGTVWMVRIAAVSHAEDADVLVSALRKRGYAVSSRRDPADNLLHVQVGPFATHGDASAMRQRLLNDGYNAIIEP